MWPTLAAGEYAYAGKADTSAASRQHHRLLSAEGSIGEELWPVEHVVEPGGAACAEPVPRHTETARLIKRIVAALVMKYYVKRGHVYRDRPPARRRSSENRTPSTNPAARARLNFPVPIRIPAGDWFTLPVTTAGTVKTVDSGVRSRETWIVGVVRACSRLGKPWRAVKRQSRSQVGRDGRAHKLGERPLILLGAGASMLASPRPLR